MNVEDTARPYVVLISGAPGSGKTTLGWELSRRLHVPFISRDDIKTGLHVTHRSDDPHEVWRFAQVAFDTFFAVVGQFVAVGVSVVIEAAFHAEHGPADLDRLGRHATLIHITRSTRLPRCHCAGIEHVLRRAAVTLLTTTCTSRLRWSPVQRMCRCTSSTSRCRHCGSMARMAGVRRLARSQTSSTRIADRATVRPAMQFRRWTAAFASGSLSACRLAGGCSWVDCGRGLCPAGSPLSLCSCWRRADRRRMNRRQRRRPRARRRPALLFLW